VRRSPRAPTSSLLGDVLTATLQGLQAVVGEQDRRARHPGAIDVEFRVVPPEPPPRPAPAIAFTIVLPAKLIPDWLFE
jgi:hypothetical protein